MANDRQLAELVKKWRSDFRETRGSDSDLVSWGCAEELNALIAPVLMGSTAPETLNLPDSQVQPVKTYAEDPELIRQHSVAYKPQPIWFTGPHWADIASGKMLTFKDGQINKGLIDLRNAVEALAVKEEPK